MARVDNLENFLTDVASAIKNKSNIITNIFPNNFDNLIENIETGANTADATARPNDIVFPKTAYVNGQKITGTIHSVTNGEVFSNEVNVDYVYNNTLGITFNNPRDGYGEEYMIEANGQLTTRAPFACVSNVIGLTPNILKNGVTILDVTGNLESGENLTNIIAEQSNIISNLQNIVNNKATGGGTGDTVLPDGIKFSGSECSQLPNFNTSQITSMLEMFSYCHNLTSVPNYDTSNVIRMGYAFEQCFNLVDIPQFNTTKVTDMTSAFEACNNLSNASIQNIINMCINSNVTVSRRNLSNIYPHSLLFNTKFDNSYYTNRLTDLTNAGWNY